VFSVVDWLLTVVSCAGGFVGKICTYMMNEVLKDERSLSTALATSGQ
jgi:hypothetical protein